jgi:hypothetical protein
MIIEAFPGKMRAVFIHAVSGALCSGWERGRGGRRRGDPTLAIPDRIPSSQGLSSQRRCRKTR